MEKQVSREEYQAFVENYPRKLIKDVCAIAEPPLITFNDFTLGHWPKSIVARTWAYSDIPGDRYYEPMEDRRYFIRTDSEED